MAGKCPLQCAAANEPSRNPPKVVASSGLGLGNSQKPHRNHEFARLARSRLIPGTGNAMVDILRPDICVIGAGAGGMSAVSAAAALGASVVLVEKGKMGDAHANHGSVPSKALLATAKRLMEINTAPAFGITAQTAKIQFLDVQRHIEQVLASIAPNASGARFTALGARVIEGEGRFEDAETLVVEGEDLKIRARRFVIATGSLPAIPAIDGLSDFPYWTNETIFRLTTPPKQLVIIGAGGVALEFAQAFSRLGSAVTVLSSVQPLADDDPECVEVVLRALASERIAIRSGIAIKSVKRGRGKARVLIAGPAGEESIEGTHLLVAAGRTPNVGSLDLKAAGIAATPNGIVVGKSLKTTNRCIYAIGEVVGAPPSEQVANYQAEFAVRNALLRRPVRVSYAGMPRVTYTDPELAHAGLTEAQARARRYAIRILRWPYRENARAQIEHQLIGHIKVITTRRGRILGATIVGASAGELIAPWALALSQRLNVRALAEASVAHPTLAEIGRRAAISYYGASWTGPVLRRIIGLFRRLG
jgi:pyruvate/2-oxoglutarate dehydrogenase complex dihydrolipoamide dehydrogenase (E3) component